MPNWMKAGVLAGAVAAIVGVALYAVVLRGDKEDEACMVLVSGQKVCGDDARAWCNATDDLRVGSLDDASVAAAQDDCNAIRGFPSVAELKEEIADEIEPTCRSGDEFCGPQGELPEPDPDRPKTYTEPGYFDQDRD